MPRARHAVVVLMLSLEISEVQSVYVPPMISRMHARRYGDQLTNMLQPFWALPLMGITQLHARQLLPYTCRFFLVGFAIFSLAVIV